MSCLHYRGNRMDFDKDHLLGPDLFGAYWLPTTGVYNPDTDRTTIFVRPVAPKELEERLRDG